MTALILAAEHGQAEVVEWLLQHGANPNKNVTDAVPLDVAESHVTEAIKTVAIKKSQRS